MEELNLLSKRKKGFLRIVFSRTGIILLLCLITVAIFVLVEGFAAHLISAIIGGATIFNMVVIIMLINSDMDSSAKLTWVLIVSVTSVIGTLFYLFTKDNYGERKAAESCKRLIKEHKNDIVQDEETYSAIKKESPETAELVYYLNNSGAFPATTGNEVTYFPLGEDKYAALIDDLLKAEKFIFLEYFIIDEGKMWGTILKILADKAKDGVDVRLLYDGTCAISLLPYKYPEMIEKYGIKCKMFSPIVPFMSTHYNNRDHRKILVVDGKIGYTGGVNLADEYINQKVRFGHWKDTAIRIRGKAVDTMTLMFLNMWSLDEQSPDYSGFFGHSETFPSEKGYTIPYGDHPFDTDKVGEKVYMNILNRADSYVHIMTPYLVPDDTLLTALKYAAERGVDVKLILPGIPDKKAVYALSKSYFRTLLDSGVEIYLYTPGFVHAKEFISDDIKAVVGTINLDYRSLYHHFECGVYMYDVKCISDIENDFQDTLSKCARVSYESIKNEKFFVKFTGWLLRLIAPLL